MTKVRDPVARLVDVETTERLHNSDEEFDRLRREIAKAFSSQSKEEINAWVDEAVNAVRTRPTTQDGRD